MAASEFLEFVSEAGKKSLKDVISDLDRIKDLINEINRNSKNINIPSQAKNNASASSSANAQINKNISEQERLINKLNDARKAEAIEIAKVRVQLSELNKENKKAATEALGVMDAYQKLSSELNEVRAQARAVAAEMFNLEQAGEQNSTQYQQLSNTYSNLNQRVTLLNTGLTRIDRSLGDHRRNVGNYESAWNGLGNAINQLTREAPAFAVSMNTGFLAISNNIPMLFDELKKLRLENERLIAQGQPVKSVFSQFASSLFTLQTALSAGITFLTLYGSKLIEWATNTKKATAEIDLLRQATERYQDTLVEVTTNSEKELTSLQRKIAVAKDVTKSDEERLAAAKAIKEQYAGYLENLSEEDIMLANNVNQTEAYIKSVRQLTSDIQKRIDAEAKQSASRESLRIAAELEQEVKVRQRANEEAQKAIEAYGFESGAAQQALKSIRQQIKARQELLNEDKEFVSKFGQVAVNTSGSVTGIGLYMDSQMTELTAKSQALRDEVRREQEEINKVFQETSLLDFKPETDKNKDLQIEALKDFVASEYELNMLRLQHDSEIQKKIMDNEEVGYERREKAAEDYAAILTQMANMRLAESLRLLEQETNNEIAELNRRAKEGEITQQNANAVIKSIQAKVLFDQRIAYENYAQEMANVSEGIKENLKGVWDGINLQKADNLISERELAASLKYGERLKEIVKLNNDYRQIAKATKELEDSNKSDAISRVQVEIDGYEAQLRAMPTIEANQKKRLDLEDNILQAKKRQSDLENQQTATQAENLKKLQMATEAYLNTFTSNAFSEFGFRSLDTLLQLDEAGKTTFQNLIEGANTTTEKFAVAFNAITSVAKDAFAFMNQNSQAYFDAEYSRLDAEFQIRKKFASDSNEAQQELQREYEQRQRQIRMRELKAEKEQAIFNAIINTAQGVTAALAKANIPLSVLIGALGAAQVAMIASREIPAYKMGTANHPGGPMLVNDAPGSNYRELVQTPDGKAFMPEGRNALLDMPKGTKVFKAGSFENELNEIMQLNSIDMAGIALRSNSLPDVEINSGVTASEMHSVMDSVMGKHLANSTSFNVSLDEKGFKKYLNNRGNKTHYLDNKFNLDKHSLK